ncbi:MAG TPA: M48 family metallopeptidase [Methylibium sp.]|nr:M48 family metallopeptidase [Methylibium sp.]
MHNVCRFLGQSLLIALGLLTGCASTTTGGAIGLKRSQLLLVSSTVMERKGAEAYSAMTAEASKKSELNVNPEMTTRVRGIAAKLIPHVGEFRKDAADWKWEVNVFDSDQLNAFCMPGGKIGFYRGIIEKLDLNDDEIASIMGHEISHALREHSREKASQQVLGQAVIAGLAGAQKPQYQRSTSQIAQLAAQLFMHLPFSRHMESEADAMGLELSARAGYDPAAAVRVWEKMGRASTGAPPEFLSTHPSGATRIADIKAMLPTVQPIREQALARQGASPTANVAVTAPSAVTDRVSTSTPSTTAGVVATLAPANNTATTSAANKAPMPTRGPSKSGAPQVSGAESFQLRTRILRETPSCSPDPAVHVVAKEIGAESYEAECLDGTVLRFTCSIGNCKSVLASQAAGKNP